MNPIVIRHLDDETLQRLKQLAWHAGRSPQEMAQHLLVDAITSRPVRRLGKERSSAVFAAGRDKRCDDPQPMMWNR